MRVVIVRGTCEEYEAMVERTLAAHPDDQSDDDIEADQLHFEAAVARELAGDVDQ